MNLERQAGKTLILGLGNDILTDDAVGLLVVRELQSRLLGTGPFEFNETVEVGLTLLDLIGGYDGLVLIDSIQTGQAQPGTIHLLDPQKQDNEVSRAPHFLGVPETIALGRALGFPMPERIRIFGIEVADPFTLSTSLTSSLQAAMPAVIDTLAQEVVAFAWETWSAAGCQAAKTGQAGAVTPFA